ncbi:hypothetical protein WJX72_009648 [[Myrmecia] bisecta]|uniref:Protein kinase domain-containing protein n=1 Tax=[Myrmecia] bisecta TaxID=41462 RepID=A0AAW1PXZ7_9CHLO
MGLFSILRESKDKTKGPAKARSDEVEEEEEVIESLTIASRAKSEFFPSKKQARFDDVPDRDSGPSSPKIPAYNVRSTAKSFTQATSPFSGVHSLTPRSDSFDLPSPSNAEYNSISQFSQKVELYRGSISTVYKAQCLQTQRTVIIKAYDKPKMKLKNFLRMEREIKLMRMLQGDGLVQLFGVFEDDTYKYLIMEYCKGGDLFKYMLLRGGFLDEHWVCVEIIAPMLRVLVQLHKEHVMHRDIKPENIFLTQHQKFKLGDLGLAIQSDKELPFTRSGTLDYMAPEVLANPTADIQESPTITKVELKARGIRPYDEKVDVWATGILAYELVVGKPPFEVNDEVQTATMIMFSNKINFPPKFSPLWADFVKQALEKKPHIRPSAAQLLEHPWVKLHERKHARETGAVPASLEDLAAPIAPPAPAPVTAAAKVAAEGSAPRRSVSVGGAALAQRVAQAADKMEGLQIQVNMMPSEGERVTPPSPSTPCSPMVRSNAAQLGLRPFKSNVSKLAEEEAGLSHGVEGSGGSFANLMKAAKMQPLTAGQYVDSGDVLDEEDRNKGGIRIRMKHYFHRQKGV